MNAYNLFNLLWFLLQKKNELKSSKKKTFSIKNKTDGNLI